jgi:integrase
METIKLKSGTRFREKIYLENGQTLTKTFLRKTDARLWKNEMLSNRSKGIPLLPKESSIDLSYATHFDEWIRISVVPRGSEKTLADYKSVGRIHLLPLFGSKMLSQIRSNDGEELVRTLKAKGLANKTSNKIITLFKQTLLFACRQGYLEKNPVMNLRGLKVDQKKMSFLSDLQVLQLLRSNSRESFYPILITAVNTGMRIGELCGLCWDRVNFDTNQIEVTRTRVRGKLKETTKTHLVRYLPMNPEVRSCLKGLWKAQKGPQFVFTNECGQPLNPDHFSQRVFAAALKKAGLDKIRFHDLRHTFASQFMMKSGNIYDLQKLLGHTKVEMTMKYAHLTNDHMQKAGNTVRFSAHGDQSGSPDLAHEAETDRRVLQLPLQARPGN